MSENNVGVNNQTKGEGLQFDGYQYHVHRRNQDKSMYDYSYIIWVTLLYQINSTAY